MMQFYVELNKPDSGSLSISKNDPIYSQIEIGKLVKVVYRGQPRGSGGFFVENVQRDDAKSGDLGEEWVKITGRGALSILEDAIIDYDAGGEAQRSFASQTMAAMLITLLTEAQARGCFPKLRWNFSASMDSAGDAWDDLQSLSFSVGSSLLDVLASMTDLGIDFRMSYDWVLGDYVLYGYALGIGDLRSGVVFRKGLNAEEVTDTQESGELKNSYLVQYTGGSTWINDTASAAAYRRRETAFSAGSADNASDASMLANVQLSDTKDPKRQISIKVSDAAGPRVFVDYGIGDWVYYDRGDGQTPSLYRIRAMTLDWGDIQYPSITLDLNSILLEREIKNEIALRKIGGSNIGSTLSSPTDAGAELTLHKTDATAHSSRPLGGDLAGTLGVPGVAKLRGVALDNPLTISDGQVLKFDSALSKLVGADVDWTEIASKPGTFTPSAHTHVEADITDLDAVPEAPTDGTEYVRKNAGWVANSGGSGADANAIHVNETAEINGIAEKTSVADDDVFLIEDSADSYNKKKVKASNLPSGGGSGGHTTPTIRAYASNYGSSSTSGITIPASAEAGDLLVIFVGSNYNVSGLPTGWVRLAYTAGGYHNGALYAKICAAADIGATVSISLAGSEPWDIYAIVVAGWTNISGYACTQSGSNYTSFPTGPIGMAALGDLILIFGSYRVGSKTLTCPDGDLITSRSADGSLSSAAWAIDGTSFVLGSSVGCPVGATPGTGILSIR